MQQPPYILLLAGTLLAGILAMPAPAEAQTCSCAGAPLISSQSISTTSSGNLLVGLTYQYNDISLLYSENSRLKNNSVRRHTRSTLLEFSYGLTRRITLTGTASLVQKYRETGLGTPGPNPTLTTRGIGDGLLMLKYVLHQNTIREQYQLAAGIGIKAPVGRHSLRDGRLPLNADMQPGTGAWDGVLWSYFSKSFAPATTLNVFWFNTYRRTGTAERFGKGDRYKFGNEWVSTAGITDKLAGDLSYVFMLRYRSTAFTASASLFFNLNRSVIF
ncbi:MAG: hypothetical protein U5K31_03270 [Balneolaceae bacterium]|nr:hypothetical protein [Balneolaceae bacterium]